MQPITAAVASAITIPTWDKWVFYCLFIALASFEFLGVKDSKFTTITALTCQYVPAWTRAMILGWLCFHFLIQHPR